MPCQLGWATGAVLQPMAVPQHVCMLQGSRLPGPYLEGHNSPWVSPRLLLQPSHALLFPDVIHQLGWHERVRGAQQRKRLPAGQAPRSVEVISRCCEGGSKWRQRRLAAAGGSGHARPCTAVRRRLAAACKPLPPAPITTLHRASTHLLIPLGFTSLGSSFFLDLEGGGASPSRGTPRMSFTSPIELRRCFPGDWQGLGAAAAPLEVEPDRSLRRAAPFATQLLPDDRSSTAGVYERPARRNRREQASGSGPSATGGAGPTVK